MSDIALLWRDVDADAVVTDGDILTDDGLQTAVVISLFTDRRADPDDRLPEGETDPRGWWGDLNEDIQTGSRLWLLRREKQLPAVRQRAEDYCREALQWLIDDEIASSVTVIGSWLRRGVLALHIVIHRPGQDDINYRFSYNWEAQSYAVLQA